MRIGILGGAFDPIHSGHIDLAARAREALGLDRVLLMPAGKPPYKACLGRRKQRMRMVEIAAEGQAGLFPCGVETERKGKTYTVDTLKILAERFPGDELVYIVGADALGGMKKWYGIETVARLASFAVAGRPGYDRAEAEAQADRLARKYGARFEPLDFEGRPVSSGEVRARAAAGEALDGLVPDGVAAYIRENGLYLCAYREKKLLEKLRGAMTLHRYYHTLGVADTAERLAARYGVDPKRARLAGLLHDCAKSMPYGEMRKLVTENVPDADRDELEAEPVLHAPAGMVLARRDYGVRDPEILQAIRRHTLGGPHMTAMDAVIYVADFIEPGRKSFEGLERTRAAAESDIFEAMYLSAKLSTDYLIARGRTPNPRTQCILDEYREKYEK